MAGPITLVRQDKQNLNAPRFTPTELEVLLKNGELTDADLVKLHPDDLAVVNKLRVSQMGDPIAMGLGLSGMGKDIGTGLVRGFKRGFSGSGKIADMEGFDRAISSELKRLRGIKGPTNTPYPPNVQTEEGFSDLADRVTGASRNGQVSPLKWHESAPEGLGSDVAKLKRQTKRRSPKPE